MPMPISREWEYFRPSENDDTIHGMERMLEDGTAIDVIAYGTYDAPGEFSWMIRLWDGAGYTIRASYDDGIYFEDIESAYDNLVSVLVCDYPFLVEKDEIKTAPDKAKGRFFAKIAAIGLAAALILPTITGCAGTGLEDIAFAAPEPTYTDVPLGTGIGTVSYSQLISDDTFYEGYTACVDLMASGANPETNEGTGWYDGDFEYEEISIDMLNYACYDNPMFTLYRTGADSGVSILFDSANGDFRISSDAMENGDDFLAMYDQVDAAARNIANIAYSEADGSTGKFIESVTRQLAENITYSPDHESAHANDIYGALINGDSRCYGYAASMKYILDMQEIPNFIATGTVDDIRHAWNMVKLDETWYVVDATYTSSMMRNEGFTSLEDCASPYFYCLRTIDDINADCPGTYTPEEETWALMNY